MLFRSLSHLDCDISVHLFEKVIDSSDMNPQHWITIAEVIEKEYNNYDGFVVLHGSDTMSYSASALSFMLQGLTKPVIFTGSQLPIGDLRTDAKENLITSIQLAALKENGESRSEETRLNSSHTMISYAVFCLKKKKNKQQSA